MGLRTAYSGLEGSDLLVCQSIGLGNDGNKVDLGVQALHNFDVQRLKGVAGGLDEEYASMDAVVNNVDAINLVLGVQVGIETLLDIVNDWTPRLVIVHKVAKAGGINDGQPKTHTGFFNISADGLDRDGLGGELEAGSLALLGRVEGGVEQRVDKG